MNFKILLENDFVKPIKCVNGNFEIYAYEDTEIEPKTHKKVKTGIKLDFPVDYFAYIKYETDSLVTIAGVVDSDYRGEVMVMLYNQSDKKAFIKKGEMCANIVFHEIKHKKMEEIFN